MEAIVWKQANRAISEQKLPQRGRYFYERLMRYMKVGGGRVIEILLLMSLQLRKENIEREGAINYRVKRIDLSIKIGF